MGINVRMTSVDELQFLTCFKHQLWGSKRDRFKEWMPGDLLVFIVEKTLAGLAEVSGEPYYSKEPVWDNGIFPYRIPIQFKHVTPPEGRTPILGEVREALIASWGPKYGLGILSQTTLKENNAGVVIRAIKHQPNQIEEINRDIEARLIEARRKREKSKAQKKVRKPKDEVLFEVEDIGLTKKEESLHTKAQKNLIRLGGLVGCSVWVATNDRSRTLNDKQLGSVLLEELPQLGLSNEATKRISYIDILWVTKNSPLFAFEVETTTSIYSGLLRMADLLSVVPALKIGLFVVAPEERQDKVMAELSRPTFQTIGLSDYCQFISIESLESLLKQVGDFGGYIGPDIIYKYAVRLEEE